MRENGTKFNRYIWNMIKMSNKIESFYRVMSSARLERLFNATLQEYRIRYFLLYIYVSQTFVTKFNIYSLLESYSLKDTIVVSVFNRTYI